MTSPLASYHSALSTVAAESPLIGMAMTVHRNKRGQPMSFAAMPYLIPLFHDFPDIEGADIQSCVQSGKSELMIALMLYQSGWRGRITAYVSPTFGTRSRFVQGRIDPLLQTVPEYAARSPGGESFRGVRAASNQRMKAFGAGALMFLGSNTPSDFVEFSADVGIIDEVDQSDPQNLARLRDRLRASPYPQLFRIGNPSIPNEGISKMFDQSDQRKWYYKCDSCGERQPLDWFVNFVRQTDEGLWEPRDRTRAGRAPGSVVISGAGKIEYPKDDLRPCCRRCEKPMERRSTWDVWIPEALTNRRRGYRISRLDILTQSIYELFFEWMAAQGSLNDLSVFHTSVLGLPYEHSGARLTVEDLTNASVGEPIDYAGGDEFKDEVVTMGVDVGAVLNVHISVTRAIPDEDSEDGFKIVRQAVFVGACRRFSEIDDMIERYNVDTCVIDAMPETRKCQELRDRWLGNGCDVWLCRFFPTDRFGRQRFGLKVDYTDRAVQVDRTQSLDAAFEDIKFKRRTFPEDVFTVLQWSEQMRAPVRVLDKKKQRIIWTEGSKPDHYRLSDCYDLIASVVAQLGGTYSSG